MEGLTARKKALDPWWCSVGLSSGNWEGKRTAWASEEAVKPCFTQILQEAGNKPDNEPNKGDFPLGSRIR